MSPFLVRWIKLSLVVVVGCGFLAMAIYAFVMRDEIRNAQIEPPLVMAPEGPLKSRPEQPGGMEIPNRDKLVFDLLDSNATVSGDFPAPSPSQAAAVDMDDSADAISTGVSASAALQPLPQMKEVTPTLVEAAPQVVQAAPTPVAATPAPIQPAVAKIEPKPAEIKAATKPEIAAPVAAASSWSVQLAAVSSKVDGDKAAAKLKELPALRGLQPRVVPAPDGKHFRVQFTGVKDRNAAAAICGKLASTKQACLPVAPK